MPFPSPSVTPPTLASYQWQFNGFKFGPGTPLEITKIEGADMPAVRSSDAGRPRDHGRFIGLDVMDGRDITLTCELAASASVAFDTAWQQLSTATVPGGVLESPLFVNLPGYGTLVTMARVRKRSMPIDVQFALGQLANVTLMFSSSDPRWYSTPTLAPQTGLASPTAGFSFPLTFNLQFGGGGSVGAVSVNNAGDIETRPLLVITGPCVTPTVQNSTLPGGPYLTFGVSMATGDQLVIDTDMHTATYYVSGTTVGSTRLATLGSGSSWWTLAPGVNSIAFSSKDQSPAAGSLAVWYASAFIV